ncbi:MAG: hypothetical protein IKR04_05565 [Clostridia bacterium]|nr:hypothetical protein [Clostridia bacterium]
MVLESLLFFVPATILLACGLFRLFRVLIYKDKCTEKVSATITDFKYIEYMRFSYYKSPIYKYTYDGVEYNVKSKMCYLEKSDDKNKGHLVYLMINPNKPSQIYDCTSKYVADTAFYIVFAIIVSFFGFYILFNKDIDIGLFKNL